MRFVAQFQPLVLSAGSCFLRHNNCEVFCSYTFQRTFRQEKPLMRYFVRAVLFAFLACPAFAGEISVLGGYGATNNPVEKTYAWQGQHMEGLGDHFAYSLSYLNQGHFLAHHRDGNVANLWVRTNLLDRQLSLAAGVGGL
jgi:hypothetical protein